MYKVFVKDIPIIFSTEKKINSSYINIPLKRARVKNLVKRIYKGETLKINLYHKNEEAIEKIIRKKFKVVEAGGGRVTNKNAEYLFIRRNKKWDLPKGKIEKGENAQEAAKREVIEETGIKDLEVREFLMTTYHVFKRNRKFRLKITYWYDMYSDFEGPFIPQEQEGIKKVKWKNSEKTEEALEDSYENIKLLFQKELQDEMKANPEKVKKD